MNNLKVVLKGDSEVRNYSIPQFEKIFGITYQTKLLCSDWKVESWLKKKCAQADKRGSIGLFSLWLGHLHNKVLLYHAIPDISIRWIDDFLGYGLFATKPFKKWQYIGEYTGLLRRRNLFFPNVNDYCFMYPRAWMAARAYTIDSEKHGNYTRFINHSDSPNCESLSAYHDGLFRIIFRTVKDVSEGDELTYDYGDIYWKRRKKISR